MLQSEGIESHVVDPASIATSRRRRRAKTDKIDGEALIRALLWLRHQPDSALSRWFHERIERSRGRRKTIIVALARKLLVALWRYVTAGIVIEGATMKA